MHQNVFWVPNKTKTIEYMHRPIQVSGPRLWTLQCHSRVISNNEKEEKMDAQELVNNIIVNTLAYPETLLSTKYNSLALQANNHLKITIYKNIAKRLREANEDLFVALPLIESDRDHVLHVCEKMKAKVQQREDSFEAEAKEKFYQQAVIYYNIALAEIYSEWQKI